MFASACAGDTGSTGDDPADTAENGSNEDDTTEDGGDNPASSGGDAFTIGAVQPLSGEAAAIGEFTTHGAELAADHLREEGVADLTFTWEDSQLDTQVGVTATERLIGQDLNVILTGGSSVIVAQAPVADREEVVLVNTMAQSPLLADVSDWVVNALPTSDAEIEQVADIAINDLGAETFGILVVDSDLGVGDRDVMTEQIEAGGGTVVASETFPVGATDMRTALTRIRSAEPDALYIIGNTDEIGQAIAQTQELGIETQLLGRTQSIDPTVLEAAGPAADGMIGVGTVFRPAEDNEIGQRFLSEYQERHGSEPSVYAAIAYDATRLIGEVLADVGDDSDTEAIRDSLRATSDYPGAMGAITIGDDNTANYPLFAWQVVDGQVEPYEG